MSVRLSMDWPRACSGLMYAAVPMTSPSRVPAAVTVGSLREAAVDFGRRKCLGQAEVEDLDLTLRRDLDVGGLEIAMDDALRVCRIERVGNLAGQPHRLAHRHRPARDDVGERVALDQLEHQGANAVNVFDPVERRDVRMIERSEQPRLSIEPRQSIRIERRRGGEDLDRHIAAEPRIARAIDLAHSPGSDGADDLVRSQAGARTQSHRLACQRHSQSL